jgi:hypothetical protein
VNDLKSIREHLEISVLEDKPEKQETRQNGAFRFSHTFNTSDPTPVSIYGFTSNSG